MFIFKLSIKCCQNMFIKLQHTKTHCHQYPKLHFAKIGIETLSPPSSTRNIMFICFYATSLCLCHLYSFLLYLWRFCMMYGIWPSVLSSRIENTRLSSLGDSKCWETWLIFIFIFLWCHENGYQKCWFLTFLKCALQTFVFDRVVLMKLNQNTAKLKD